MPLLSRSLCFAAILSLVAFGSGSVLAAEAPKKTKDGGSGRESIEIDPKRVAEIAALLPASPKPVLLVPASDRGRWGSLPAERLAGVLKAAEATLKNGLPPWSDETYLEYSKTGKRGKADRLVLSRSEGLANLVIGECVENKGRFIRAICAAVDSLAADKSWTMPSHDYVLDDFYGKAVVVDLAAVRRALVFTGALCLLDKKLPAATQLAIRDALETRIFKPYRERLKIDAASVPAPPFFWMRGHNNWNAVCHAGVVVSALSVLPDPKDRALFVGAAEIGLRKYFEGTTDDGYCSEGIGYWGYGFGNFSILSLAVREASGGKIDWFKSPKVAMMGSYAGRMELLPGIYPAYADCSPVAVPAQWLAALMGRLYGAQERAGMAESEILEGREPQMVCQLLFADSALNSASPVAGIKLPAKDGLRDFFEQAGILNCRPHISTAPDAFAASLKGGHNAEEHNHNDVGSFVIATPGAKPPLIVDPGSEVYTSRTFSAQRYTSQALSSWGHSVPLVDGKPQSAGRKAQAKVVERKFSDAQDVFALDLTSAYDQAAGLTRLTRTFTYTRAPQVALSVVDELSASGPMSFGSALLTYEQWKQTGPKTLLFYSKNEALEVVIDCGQALPEIHATVIDEDMGFQKKPTRVGISIPGKSKSAKIMLTIRRVPAPNS